MKRTNLFIHSILFFAVLFFTSEVFAQKSKKTKTTKTTKTKTVTTTTTTKSTKTSTETKSVTDSKPLTPEELKKIETTLGKKLSTLVKSDSLKANTSNGITLRRYISNEENKLGADILEFDSSAKYPVTSIRMILSDYISDFFEYGLQDSDLLADAILKLNSKNRANQDYLIKNYSTNVVLATKKDKIGIAENATPEKIAGQTQLLIPTEKNVLKKYALDLATLELLDQSKSEFALEKNGEEQLKKLIQLINKKYSQEAEELNNKLLTATPAETKSLNERIVVLKRREEMKKQNYTAEREYLAFLDSKKTTTTSTSTTTTTSTQSFTYPLNPVDTEKDRFTTFIYGENHPGINAREFISIPNVGVISIGYDASKLEKKDLQLFLTTVGDYQLKKTSEGMRLAPESPLAYINGKIFVLEMLKNQAYVVQFGTDLEFEQRTEIAVSPKSSIKAVGEELVVTSLEKMGGKEDIKTFKLKDLSFIK